MRQQHICICMCTRDIQFELKNLATFCVTLFKQSVKGCVKFVRSNWISRVYIEMKMSQCLKKNSLSTPSHCCCKSNPVKERFPPRPFPINFSRLYLFLFLFKGSLTIINCSSKHHKRSINAWPFYILIWKRTSQTASSLFK